MSSIVPCMTTKRTHSDEASEYLSPAAAAEFISVTVRSLARMADRGDLKAIQLPSGHRRYLRSDIEALANGGTALAADETKAAR